MNGEDALRFVKAWEEAWNAHDIERILAHYTDDVVFQSPYIVHLFGESTGEVRGKEALRHYWSLGLEKIPTLRFTIDDVRLSVDTLVINYQNQDGHAISEVLRLREGQVFWGCGAYQPGGALVATRSLGG